MKFKWNVKSIIEEIDVHGNIDTNAILETIEVQLEEFSEGVFMNINEESGCDIKDKKVSKKVMMPKTFTLMLLRIISQN